jgi:hypothetical protein
VLKAAKVYPQTLVEKSMRFAFLLVSFFLSATFLLAEDTRLSQFQTGDDNRGFEGVGQLDIAWYRLLHWCAYRAAGGADRCTLFV